ncbi:hypothetical protein SASPL_101265 [Salvia splendens]|uniref:Uncharacterized protein n=1 Tax=Salvia splendens TaxID=180675 RepID=A0A8X8YVI4_SALSN|nr:hypothetical protein SASPL_101265 [Salvia splendens]
MEKQNEKLRRENYLMAIENEKLRKRAELLNQEQQVLLSQLKQKLLEASALQLNTSSTSDSAHNNFTEKE